MTCNMQGNKTRLSLTTQITTPYVYSYLGKCILDEQSKKYFTQYILNKLATSCISTYKQYSTLIITTTTVLVTLNMFAAKVSNNNTFMMIT